MRNHLFAAKIDGIVSKNVLLQMDPSCPGPSCWVHTGCLTLGTVQQEANSSEEHSQTSKEANKEARNPPDLWDKSLLAKQRNQEAALAQSTSKKYESWWKRYKGFLQECEQSSQERNSESVARFLAQISEESQSLGGVNTARAALSHWFKREGHADSINPALSTQVDMVMKGIHRRFEKPTEKKAVLSAQQLEEVVKAASGGYNWENTSLPDHRLAAQLTFMYATSARYEEAREVTCGQLVFEANHCVVTFKKGKTYQYGENRTSVIADKPGGTFNPRDILTTYLLRLKSEGRGEKEDFLFPNLGGKKKRPASHPTVLSQFRKLLEKAGITDNPRKFGLHSLRRGSVTALANAGTSDHLIQKHMRVRSESTVRRYATLDVDKLCEVSKTVFQT